MTLLALLALWHSALPTLLLPVAVPMAIALAWRGGRSLFDPPILAAALQADGSWLLATREGEQSVRLVDHSLLASLIGLHFASVDGSRRRPCLLWPDALPPDQGRRLRVWLRSSRALAARRPTTDDG